MRAEPDDPLRSGSSLSDPPGRVRLSRNELEALCLKAARGAGMSWGHAEEAGFAAGWLSAHGLDGAAALLAVLAAGSGKPWRALCPVVTPGRWRPAGPGPLCPVALGAALLDHCELPEGRLDGGLTVGPVCRPLVVLPFLAASAARTARPVGVDWGTGSLTLDGDGAISGDIEHLAALAEGTLVLSPGTAPPGRPAAQGTPGCGRETLARLDALAMRTTVPPSDRSRADAGGGTSDND
ncbi:DUF3726 domain-containing protein [Acidimangrovimonas pyrenivorans]|uniref:DUF3726 domain-containing protein n=1 Tax=Acidimangrovimonas pyrenivorans TaxID=2030798 RepID=A0ABV7AHC5_9RHOB